LVDTMAEVIPASWNGVESGATKTGATALVDATECKTPGFGALFAICVLVAVVFVFRMGK
ncbi:MAG: PGF-CTERM sorting domain-containing protein, partial [Euryarchaeota archaeon]|nr:PGF-CTERM sorting domain-containing protein [Euryarchaeota archaeon]